MHQGTHFWVDRMSYMSIVTQGGVRQDFPGKILPANIFHQPLSHGQGGRFYPVAHVKFFQNIA